MDFLIKIFKALANEHRVTLLHTLMKKGEKEISELAQEIGIPYKTAARNLKILERTNLVVSRRWQGLAYYSLRNEPGLEYNKMLYSLILKRYQRVSK
jgi:DNA-binding transcriptional ArsR family regulator